MRRAGLSVLLIMLSAAAAAQSQSPFPLDRLYYVVSLNGHAVGALTSLTAYRRDGRLRAEGTTACNQWAGDLALGAADQFAVRDTVTTGAVCPGGSVEQEFLSALARATRWHMDGIVLILASDRDLMQLSPNP